MSSIELSDEDNIVKSKVAKRIKEKKLNSLSKSEVIFKTSKAIIGNNLRNYWKRYFRKKKKRDKISIQSSSINSQTSFMSRRSNNSEGHFESKISNDDNNHCKESNCYNRKVIDEL